MGTYGLEGVLAAWAAGRLTAEQAVGQILQLMLELERRLDALECSLLSARPAKMESHPKRRRHHRPPPADNRA